MVWYGMAWQRLYTSRKFLALITRNCQAGCKNIEQRQMCTMIIQHRQGQCMKWTRETAGIENPLIAVADIKTLIVILTLVRLLLQEHLQSYTEVSRRFVSQVPSLEIDTFSEITFSMTLLNYLSIMIANSNQYHCDSTITKSRWITLKDIWTGMSENGIDGKLKRSWIYERILDTFYVHFKYDEEI